MKQVAIYGKGGIGKSTISANLSAAMAQTGGRVLQIGCDPKQDSTRLLRQGQRAVTALDYLRATTPAARTLGAIVHAGYAGVACVEAGGPEPGVGCAGRGILSTFELLESLGVSACGYDVVLYDVLGDVVCGGFAVPLREHYAHVVYIVTSGEFMSLYAANNILRGVRNFEGGGPRVGGIIFNRRGLEDEAGCVRRFAEATRLPVVADIPRDALFGEAERQGRTVIQAFPDSLLADQFRHLADAILRFNQPYAALPRAIDRLEATVLGGRTTMVPVPPISPPAPDVPAAGSMPQASPMPPKRYCSKSVRRHEVLHGCAYNGAAHTAMQITDTLTLAHGPRSCAYLSFQGSVAAGRRMLQRYGVRVPRQCVPPLRSSAMDERVAIFGGHDALDIALRQAATERPAAVFVVTTCASGIIGDDVRVATAAARDALSDIPVIPLLADGDINGDYTQGIIDTMIAVGSRYIDPTIPPDADRVNIVAEKNLATNTEANFLTIRELLDALGVRVNCRFIRQCTTTQLMHLLRGRVNLLASSDVYGRTVRDFLIDRYQAAFLPGAFPVGFHATATWLRDLAGIFGNAPVAEEIVVRYRRAYDAGIAALRPALAGKRLFIVTQNHQIDWVLDTAWDLEMEIVKVGILASTWDDTFATRYAGRFPLALDYTREMRDEELRARRI